MRSKLACAATLVITIATVGVVSASEIVEREVTEKTTTKYSGTVSRVDPGSSTIIVRSEADPAPQTYTYTKQTTFVDETGKTVTYEAIENRPVTVYYTKQGDSMIVSKVEVTNKPGGVIERKETTTEIPR
jgi:hypothetical protein